MKDKLLNKIVLGLNIFFIVALCVINVFYQRANFNFTLKCVGSACFAVQGLINLFYAYKTKQANMKFFVIMAIGLVFAMMGDIAINLNFIAGAGIFAVGHVWFIFAYCMLVKFKPLDLVYGAVIFVGSALFILLFKGLKFDPALLKWVCLIYALIISLMLGKAISNLVRERSILNILLVVGAVLFFFSDLMLLLDNFMGTLSWTDHACMATYYPALSILAFSMYYKMSDWIGKKN